MNQRRRCTTYSVIEVIAPTDSSGFTIVSSKSVLKIWLCCFAGVLRRVLARSISRALRGLLSKGGPILRHD